MSDIQPKGENLRKAIRWLAQQPDKDLSTIDQACQQFDLSPIEEEFLLQEFRSQTHKN